MNSFRGIHDTSRILAAFNTCLITYISIFFLDYYTRRKVDIDKLRYYMFLNFLILGLLYIVFIVFGDKANLSFLHPLCGPDWLNGRYELRFRGYLEYTNLVVFMYLYCIPFAFSYLAKRWKPLFVIIFEIGSLLIIIATNSRIGIVACSLTVLLSVIITIEKSVLRMFRKNKYLIGLITILFGVATFLAFKNRIENTFNTILALRQGSTSTRFGIYTLSLERMIKESPVIGCGIKDLIGGEGFPFGSHSTYLGMYYKTGLLGGTLFLFTIIFTVVKILKKPLTDEYIFFQKTVFLALLLCFALEDLDGADWNIAVFYSLLGVFLSYNTVSGFISDEKGYNRIIGYNDSH